MAKVLSRRPLTVKAQVRAQVNPRGFVVDKVALGQVFLRVLQFSPVNISSHCRSPRPDPPHLGGGGGGGDQLLITVG
jgi:hypothetical protein